MIDLGILLSLLALGAGTAWFVITAVLIAETYRRFLSDKDH